MHYQLLGHDNNPSMTRRIFIGATVSTVSLIAVGEAASSDHSIKELFQEWKRLLDIDYSGIEGDQLDALTKRFNELADLIMTADAVNEHEFAMQFYVAVEGGENIPAEIFEKRMFAIVDRTIREGT